MRSLMDARRERLRQYVTDHGGPTSVAKALGYSNGSFLSQLIGPNPTRPFTEKVARSIEERLALAPGWLDSQVPLVAREPAPADYIAGVRAVATAADARGIKPTPTQFATLVALASVYMLPDGRVDQSVLDQLMQLIHNGGGVI